MYTVDIIDKNQFNCNWTTLHIGRQLKLISYLEVINYAVAYLSNNPNVDNENILELAWGQTEDNTDDLLVRIVSDSSSDVLKKEYHKWRYCILNEVYNTSNENIFKKIEDVFSMFNTPQDMYNFFRKVSDTFYYPSDSEHTIKELVGEFLEEEKKLIMN